MHVIQLERPSGTFCVRRRDRPCGFLSAPERIRTSTTYSSHKASTWLRTASNRPICPFAAMLPRRHKIWEECA